MARNFLTFLSERRARKEWTVAKLAVVVSLSHGTVTKYLTGERPLPWARALLLRDALCDTSEERAEFDQLYEQSASVPSSLAVAPEKEVGSELTSLRIVSLNFQPYSGCESCFMERLLRKMLNLAAIRMELFDNSRDVEIEGGAGEKFASFDVMERIDWIENREADVLINLITPDRMKGVVFTSTPIRVPINGVIFEKESGRIEEARALLVNGTQSKSDPFTVVAVEREVAHMFLLQNGAFQTRPPDLVGTLDAKGLAARMEMLSGQPVMLAVDEHTALGTVKELNGRGYPAVLVLSPNSDAAVVNFEARRTPPAYYYGLGLRRNNNYDLVSYFKETIAAYLGLESETLSTWYAELYRDLVSYLESCLRETVLYVGGLRMTKNRVTDRVPEGTNARQWQRERLLLVQQSARASARRTLSLSQRSVGNLPQELIGWRTILKRASEQIRVYEAGNREWIRQIVVYCAKMALGKDPLQVEPDVIQLLRKLVPDALEKGQISEPAISDGVERNEEQSADDHWFDFLHLLTRELDINRLELKDLEEWPHRYFLESRSLGELISKLQEILEGTSDPGIVPTIREYRKSDRKDFQNLVKEYEDHRKRNDLEFSGENLSQELLEKKIPTDEGRIPQSGVRYNKRYVAYSLGLMAGFLDLEVLPFGNPERELTPAPIIDAARGDSAAGKPASGVTSTMRVDHLFVSEHMHHAGVSRRLIRKVVEAGNEMESVGGVWLERWRWQWEKENLNKFERTGFVPLADGYFRWFAFKRETEPRRLMKRPTTVD